ncbi:hypothetical protein ABMY26_33340 [Azospirillum sp. HJ39]|uniref:hypothetical protein n=1 Tax=Azospirillum sp. HJ39 TaxID=3159496 RepID=UPI003557BE6B
MGEVIKFAARRKLTAPQSALPKGPTCADVAAFLAQLEHGGLRCAGTRPAGNGHEVDLELWGRRRLTILTNTLRMTPDRIDTALRTAATRLREQAQGRGVLDLKLFRQRWLETAEALVICTTPPCLPESLEHALDDVAAALLVLQAAPAIWAAAWDAAEGRQQAGG